MMHATQQTKGTLEDVRVSVKVKLGALWATMMFLYVYVDIFTFYKPGIIEDILVGRVWEFEITNVWALGALMLITIPSLMVFLSLALPAKVNRYTSIIIAALYIPVSAGNVLGESWAYFFFGAAVEIALLLLIIWYAWKWPSVATRQQQASVLDGPPQ